MKKVMGEKRDDGGIFQDSRVYHTLMASATEAATRGCSSKLTNNSDPPRHLKRAIADRMGLSTTHYEIG